MLKPSLISNQLRLGSQVLWTYLKIKTERIFQSHSIHWSIKSPLFKCVCIVCILLDFLKYLKMIKATYNYSDIESNNTIQLQIFNLNQTWWTQPVFPSPVTVAAILQLQKIHYYLPTSVLPVLFISLRSTLSALGYSMIFQSIQKISALSAPAGYS